MSVLPLSPPGVCAARSWRAGCGVGLRLEDYPGSHDHRLHESGELFRLAGRLQAAGLGGRGPRGEPPEHLQHLLPAGDVRRAVHGLLAVGVRDAALRGSGRVELAQICFILLPVLP